MSVESKKSLLKTEFTSVDLNTFFDEEDKKQEDLSAGIVLFSAHEQQLIGEVINKLWQQEPERVETLQKRLDNLEHLARSIAKFPSLLERSTLTASVRTPQSLIESLIANQYDGDSMLHLPSKASMGKGYLVAKIHTFASIAKLAKNANLGDSLAKGFEDMTISLLFTLMAEDVYLNLIKDTSLDIESRRELATSLIILWEHSSDQNIADIAPVLQSVWKARRELAPAFGTMVGTLGTVLFYGTATMNLVWQHVGWTAVEKRDYKKLYLVDWGLPWISHICFSVIPTVIMCKLGANVVEAIKTALPMDGIAMKTLFTVGALLPCVGIAILLKQIVRSAVDFIPYLFGFTLAASMGINLVSSTVVAGMFAIIIYKLKMLQLKKPAVVAGGSEFDDDEEEI